MKAALIVFNHEMSSAMEAVDVIHEQKGANPFSVFLSGTDPADKNLRWVAENYFMTNRKPVVDAAISFHGHSIAAYLPSEPVANLFIELGVPLLKAIATSNTFEDWRDSPLGLGFSEVSWNIAMPEFDGFVITVPIAAKHISGKVRGAFRFLFSGYRDLRSAQCLPLKLTPMRCKT